MVLSRDRYIWSQGRALWTYSALYNRIEKKEEYLRRADGLFSYLTSIGTDPEGRWNYLYDGDGNMKEDSISIYVDGFVLAGMTEYYRATKNEVALQTALEIYENTKRRIATPGSYRVAPYVIPDGMMTHGVNMIFSFFYTELGRAAGREDVLADGYRLACEDKVSPLQYREPYRRRKLLHERLILRRTKIWIWLRLCLAST